MNLKESATRVAVLRVLRDTVDAAYEAERRTVLDGLRAARAEFALKSIRVTLPDQTPVATITLIDPQPAVVVADEDAFTAWVAANHPARWRRSSGCAPAGGGNSSPTSPPSTRSPTRTPAR